MESLPVPLSAECEHNGTWPKALSETDCAAATQANLSTKGLGDSEPQLRTVLLGTLLGGLSLLTVFMNLLVLYAVRRDRMLHTVGNLYIVSLSVADLIVGATVMPLNLAYLLADEWRLGRAACQFWLVMDYVASTASIFSLFILCVDRYRSVEHPLRYLKYRTRGRAAITISGAWLVSLLWVVPILGWRSFAQVDQKPEAERQCDTDFRFVTWFKVLTATLNFYVPSVLMLWFYTKVFLAVREHYRQWERIFSPLESSSQEDSGVLHKGASRAPHRGLSACKHADRFLDQYSLEQQLECREQSVIPNREVQTVQNKTMERTLSEKRSLFRISPKINQCAENSFGSVHEGDFVSDSPSKVSARPTDFLLSGPEDDANDSRMSVNSCKVTVANSVADADEPTTSSPELYQLGPSGTSSNNNHSRQQSSQSPKTSPSKPAAVLRHSWQKFCDQSRQQVQNVRIHKERKAAQQLGLIITGFMVCWIPYFITFMVMALCTTCVPHDLHMFTIWLGYLNSTLNPFLYPMCNENFKRVFKKILHIPSRQGC